MQRRIAGIGLRERCCSPTASLGGCEVDAWGDRSAELARNVRLPLHALGERTFGDLDVAPRWVALLATRHVASR